MEKTIYDELADFDAAQEKRYKDQKTVFQCPYCSRDFDEQGNEVTVNLDIDDVVEQTCSECSFLNDMENIAKVFRRYFDSCKKTEEAALIKAFERLNEKFDGEFTVYINEMKSDQLTLK